MLSATTKSTSYSMYVELAVSHTTIALIISCAVQAPGIFAQYSRCRAIFVFDFLLNADSIFYDRKRADSTFSNAKTMSSNLTVAAIALMSGLDGRLSEIIRGSKIGIFSLL